MPYSDQVSTSSQASVTNTPPAIHQAKQAIVPVPTSQEQREPSATSQASKAVSARKTNVATATTVTLGVDITTVTSALFETIRERLSLMKKVAECKLILDKKVFDPEREKKVLESAFRIAKEYGINENTYKSFIQAQMTAAKVIQNKYLVSFDKKKVATADDRKKAENQLGILRKQLTDHGQIMGKQIREYLQKYKEFKEEMRNPFISNLRVDYLPDECKEDIFTQLLAIHPEKPMAVADRLDP